MTDVLSIIEGAIAILVVVAPIIVAKYKEAANAVSIVQSFLDILVVYGVARADGEITNEEKIKIADAFIVVAKVTSLDKTIAAEIPIPQDAVDGTVKIVEAVAPIVD